MKKRVAVLRGGPSSEYEVSLKTGASVLANMPEKYQGLDVLVDKQGVWHLDGVPFHPKDFHKKADVAFIAMHGEYGEDGKVQQILETFSIPFTGSKSLASAIGINKELSKKFFKESGMKTPLYIVLNKKDMSDKKAIEIFKTFPHPAVVKPLTGGSSVGTSIVHTLEELKKGLSNAFDYGDKVMIEEYVSGREATCGVIEKFRGKDLYELFPVEIIPIKDQTFFDYESKYSGESGAKEICPGNFSKEENKEITKMAALAHKAIGARHYSRSDFIINPKRGIYILEINTLPGLTDASLLPKEIKAIGSSYDELLEHLIELALG